MEFSASYSMLQVKGGVKDERFLTSTQTGGTSGISCEYTFTIIVCFIILYKKYLVYLAKNQDVSIMCLIHTYSGPQKLRTL